MAEDQQQQQYCLRWNNFQANITSQFEALRDDEDFTDVTIACDGQKLQAHKVVLSACSPYFKDLFKSNPCSHPIIFMRDVEARHVVALMEFMYAGEVNVAQAHLSTFLKTAESLKIRGLTDTSPDYKQKDDTLFLNPSSSKSTAATLRELDNPKQTKASACSSTVTSSQDVDGPTSKRLCKTEETDLETLQEEDLRRFTQIEEAMRPFTLNDALDSDVEGGKGVVQPKLELPDYLSDDEKDDRRNYFRTSDDLGLPGGFDLIPQGGLGRDVLMEQTTGGADSSRKLHSLEPRPCSECGRVYSNLSNLRQHMKLIHYPTEVSCPVCTKSFKTDLYLRRHMSTNHDVHARPAGPLNGCAVDKFSGAGAGCGAHVAFSKSLAGKGSPVRLKKRRIPEHWLQYGYRAQSGTTSPDLLAGFGECNERKDRESDRRNRVVKLGEGIEIYEDQLLSVKWSDYRKLTRGLATILFSPAELATCSVTGQRWSRAGSLDRPIKPALDRAKVQAIISYVATRFPMVEISRIKQVLAYKCKENSTALKLKAVRYYGDHHHSHETEKH